MLNTYVLFSPLNLSTLCSRLLHSNIITSYLSLQRLIFVATSWTSVMDNSIRLGPWGGSGGNHWNDGVHNGVREITIFYSSYIDSIRVTYDNNGKVFPAEKHGGLGGTKSAQIKLHFPDEILISVSGHYCPVFYGGSPVIQSLAFTTNERTFGPFGVEEGIPFKFLTNGLHIVGFYGKCGWFLDSLGFYLSSPKLSLFQKIQMKFRGFKDGGHKTKGSKGYPWGT